MSGERGIIYEKGRMVQPEKCLLKKSQMCPISLKHSREMKDKKCPIGLSILAVLNFIFTSSAVLSIPSIISNILDPSVNVSKMYLFVRGVFTLLYFFSGIGYLKVKWYQGYILGNITAIGSLLGITIILLPIDKMQKLV